LDGAGCCCKPNQRQFEQSAGVMHLGFFQPHAVAFQ
jgi:hypothetical protein